MKKFDSKGFAATELILLLVLAGLIVGVGYYVYSNRKDDVTVKDSTVETSDKSDKTEGIEEVEEGFSYAGWKSYSRYEVSFKYPSDWKLTAHNNTQSRDTDITSPDFETTKYSTQKGERVTIADDIFQDKSLTADNFKTKHLDSNVNPYSDYKVLEIGGKKAIQFYRGDARTTVFFVADKTVSFGLDNFPDRDAASIDYNRIIQSVTY